jgi:hypothetical protein
MAVAGGSIALHSSQFAADSDAGVLLLNALEQSEVLISGCTVKDLELRSLGTLAVVNSSFEPPLNASVAPAVRPPNCGTFVAGERLCDPRASCEPRPSGGVQCSCSGEGLQDKPGMTPDGRVCIQATSVEPHFLARTLSAEIRKPGNGEAIRLHVQVKGESTVTLVLSASMTHTSAVLEGHAFSEALNPSRNWSRLDAKQISHYGHDLLWDVPPSADAELQLDAAADLLSATRDYSFQLRVDCDGKQPCAADGDTVETIITIGSAATPSSSRSEMRLVTLVQSFLSCLHTRSRIEPDWESVPISTPIRVRLYAYDVDKLPVSFTRAEASLVFGSQVIPMQWSRGSNEYVGTVPAEYTERPGLYDLVLSASSAWNETERHATSCVLLRRTIIVTEGLSTSWVLVGGGGAAVVVVGCLFFVVRKRHAHLQAIMVMLFTEVPSPLDKPKPPLTLIPFHHPSSQAVPCSSTGALHSATSQCNLCERVAQPL